MKINNKTDDFLKRKMSVEESGIDQPESSFIKSAHMKIAAKKPQEKAGFQFKNLLTLQIKLYQAAIAASVIAVTVFFITKTNDNDETKTLQYANTDSLKSSSVKQNIFLVKNFTERIN